MEADTSAKLNSLPQTHPVGMPSTSSCRLNGLPRGFPCTGIMSKMTFAGLVRFQGPTMTTPELAELEQRVDELIELAALLSRENRALKAQQQTWSTERAKLIEKNELAKSRVEAMISRLKALEQD